MRKIESRTLHPSDIRVAEADFAALFGDVETRHGPGVSGRNFMTPEVLGYVLVKGTPVEISTGLGIYDDRIFGVTFPRKPDGSPADSDKLCWSLTEVHEHLYGG